MPPDAKAVQLGLDAFETALGRRPALIRIGGTLPIVPALADKGIPTVVTGFGLPDSQIHSPNERLVADVRPARDRPRPASCSRGVAISRSYVLRRRVARLVVADVVRRRRLDLRERRAARRADRAR